MGVFILRHAMVSGDKCKMLTWVEMRWRGGYIVYMQICYFAFLVFTASLT